MVLFYNGRNSPESLQAYDPTLGGYIIQINITSSTQVPYHYKHAPWHLGANASCFSNHHIVNKPGYIKEMSRPFYHFISPIPSHTDDLAFGGYTLLLKSI